MNSSTEIKNLVREKYGSIAKESSQNKGSSCCGSTSCCGDAVENIMAQDYSKLEGYNPEADLGLGCGLPTEFARIKEGDTVIDLGSGAGNDAFVARRIVGDKGKVIGVDFTEAMIERARANTQKLGFTNVDFRLGDIESMPVVSNLANVVVSNCVLNLVPNKHLAFSEIFRVLKPGGHFSISDIVLSSELPSKLKEAAEMYVGCVSGAIEKSRYLSIVEEAGFSNILVQREREINIPDEVLLQYLAQEEIQLFNSGTARIKSITIYAEKPAKDQRNCCEPSSGCC